PFHGALQREPRGPQPPADSGARRRPPRIPGHRGRAGRARADDGATAPLEQRRLPDRGRDHGVGAVERLPAPPRHLTRAGGVRPHGGWAVAAWAWLGDHAHPHRPRPMRLSARRGSPFRAALRVIALIVAALSAAGGAAAQQPVPGIDHEVLGLDVSLREEAYPLDAPTFAELVRALNGLSVEGAGAPLSQGLTEYRILPEWSVAAASGVCRVAEARVRVTVVVTLPIWTAVAAASDDERVRWESIRDRIRAHEHAHRDMTLEAAASLL